MSRQTDRAAQRQFDKEHSFASRVAERVALRVAKKLQPLDKKVAKTYPVAQNGMLYFHVGRKDYPMNGARETARRKQNVDAIHILQGA